MRFAALASVLTAGAMWLVLGGAPVQSQTDGKAASCQTCGQGAACQDCPKGKACSKCGKGQGQGKGKAPQSCHGKWGSHEWEYKCVRPAKKPQAMTQQFSGLGAQGWKLVDADGGIWCFSRMQKTQ